MEKPTIQNQKAKFKEWLRKKRKADGKKYSAGTVNSYATFLNTAPSELDVVDDKFKKSVFEYLKIEDFSVAQNAMLQAKNFAVVNLKRNNGFIAALKLYESFLKEESTEADEYSKFKSLLEYFVAHLEYCQNEKMSPGTGKNTRGYQKYIESINNFKKKGK